MRQLWVLTLLLVFVSGQWELDILALLQAPWSRDLMNSCNMALVTVPKYRALNINKNIHVSRGRLRDHLPYWMKLMQEFVEELERRQWCNLKLGEINQNIDENLFNMRVTGSVQYSNGFVISIQKIDITNVEQLLTSRTVDGAVVPFGTVRGRINFRDMLVGHDVYANLTSPRGEHRVTGTFLHLLAQIQLDVTQNLITKETTSNPTVTSVTAGSGVRMIYMPPSNITEALGRHFSHNTFSSAGNWGRDIFAPILVDLVTNKIGFPEVCFNNC